MTIYQPIRLPFNYYSTHKHPHTHNMSHSVLRELPNCFWTGKKGSNWTLVILLFLYIHSVHTFIVLRPSWWQWVRWKKYYINTKIPLKFFREFENIFNNNYTFVRGVTCSVSLVLLLFNIIISDPTYRIDTNEFSWTNDMNSSPLMMRVKWRPLFSCHASPLMPCMDDYGVSARGEFILILCDLI